jgi:hypothetical protein
MSAEFHTHGVLLSTDSGRPETQADKLGHIVYNWVKKRINSNGCNAKLRYL